VIDLHCHLLPGVDDGPATMEETVEYARTAARDGTETIVATPHVEQVEVAELPERVREVRQALAEEGIELEVRCGGELKPFSIPALSQDELETISHGPPGRRWLLLEVPFRGLDDNLVDGAQELRARGFSVLLAHPERASRFRDSIPVLREQVERGAGVQMNVGPLTGAESPIREDAARRLLRTGLPTALATDAHPPGRPYTLREGRELALGIGLDEAEATRLVSGGPRALLDDGLGFPATCPG
jgi:protein-tyrosine phosphatase